jgi:glycosyltransferase involved in cell wall biosynthesis
MPTSPPVTVVLPAHNAEATIAQAIASTLQQSYTEFELWVLENGSKDRTAEIARSFTDPRVKVFELGPVGFQGALQYAIENASSEWLARMDADDLMFPDRLQVEMEVIEQRPELVLVGTAHALLTPFGHIFERVMSCRSREVDTSRLGWGRFFADPSTIYRRRVALEVGGVDPEFTIGDVPLWFRMLTRGKGWEIAEPLHLWRIQPHSMSKSSDFPYQALRARAKYAPQTVDRWPKPPEKGDSGWYLIASLELLGGDGNAVRQAAHLLEPEAPRAARRLRWLSYWRRVGYICYRWRHRSRDRYRRRPDWEQLFAPLLGRGEKALLDNETAGIANQQRGPQRQLAR